MLNIGATWFCFILKALKRFNSLLTSNSLLRSEIDNLRNERERYENLSEKSENELRDLRAQLVECIDHSVISYEQRYGFLTIQRNHIIIYSIF